MAWFWFLCDLVLNWWWSLILRGCWCFGHARFGFDGLEWFLWLVVWCFIWCVCLWLILFAWRMV